MQHFGRRWCILLLECEQDPIALALRPPWLLLFDVRLREIQLAFRRERVSLKAPLRSCLATPPLMQMGLRVATFARPLLFAQRDPLPAFATVFDSRALSVARLGALGGALEGQNKPCCCHQWNV